MTVHIAIIGAGPSGLATAYHLLKTAQRMDVDVRVKMFDTNSGPGGTWSKDSAYPGLVTNNSWKQMLLDDDGEMFKMFKTSPEGVTVSGGHRVTGEGMTIVMESIARQLVNLDAEIHYQTKVVNVLHPKSGQWTLSIRPVDAPDDSPVMHEDFDKLVVAVGLYSTPAVPLCIQPFAVKYRGTITSNEADAPFVVHTSGLADEGVQQAIRAKQREVVVIGASKSALDAAERLALDGHPVTLVLKNPPYLAPPFVKNRDGTQGDPNIVTASRGMQCMLPYYSDPITGAGASGGWLASWIRWLLHYTTIGGWLHQKYQDEVKKVFGKWNEWGNPKLAGMQPIVPLMWSFSQLFPGPFNLITLIKDGKIKVVKGAVTNMSKLQTADFDGFTIQIDGKHEISAEGVICGTGWQTGRYPFFNDQQVEDFGLPISYSEENPSPREQSYEWLDRESLRTLLANYKTLRTMPPEWATTHRPARLTERDTAAQTSPYRLYRLMVPLSHLEHRDIVFPGIPSTVSNHVLFVTQAHWIADYLLGTLPALPNEEMARREVSSQSVWSRRLFGPSHGPLGVWLGSCWIDYCSRLCADMGVDDDKQGLTGPIYGFTYDLEHKRIVRGAIEHLADLRH